MLNRESNICQRAQMTAQVGPTGHRSSAFVGLGRSSVVVVGGPTEAYLVSVSTQMFKTGSFSRDPQCPKHQKFEGKEAVPGSLPAAMPTRPMLVQIQTARPCLTTMWSSRNGPFLRPRSVSTLPPWAKPAQGAPLVTEQSYTDVAEHLRAARPGKLPPTIPLQVPQSCQTVVQRLLQVAPGDQIRWAKLGQHQANSG